MSITLNGTFEVKDGETPVTFSSKTDTDKIIDVVKTMVEDYNAIVSEVKKGLFRHASGEVRRLPVQAPD